MKKSTYTPFIVIAILLLVLFAGKHTPLNAKSFFYAISLSIQSLLMAILPFLIFTFLFNSIASFKKNAVIFLLLVMFCICLSNFTYTMIAYFFNSLNLMGEVNRTYALTNSKIYEINSTALNQEPLYSPRAQRYQR